MAQSLLTRIKRNASTRDSNAAATFSLINEAASTYAEHGDWTCLAWLVALGQGADGKRIAAIIEAAIGVRFKADAKQPSGLRKVAGDAGENNRIALLAQYAELGISFRSKALENDDDLPALLVPTATKSRTVEEIILAAVRKARKDCDATDARMIEALRVALAAD